HTPPTAAINQSLLAQTEAGEPSPLALWSGPATSEEGRGFSLAALSFLAYLLGLKGPSGLRAFIVAAAAQGPEPAAREAYRSSLEELRRAWWKHLRKAAEPEGGSIGRFLRGSLHYLRPYWKQEILIFAFLGVQLAFQQILPRAQALLIDRAILPRDLHYLFGLAVFLFGLVVLVLFTGVLNDLVTTRVSGSVLRTLRERMFGQLQRLSNRFYGGIDSGDILSRFSGDLRAVESGLTGTLTSGAFLLLSLVVSTVRILLINWILGIIVLATLPFFLISTRVLGPRASRASLAFSKQQAVVTGVLKEDIAAQPVIQAYNLQRTVIDRFRVQAGELYRSAVRLFFLSSLFGVTANLLTTAVQVGVLALGGYFVIQGKLPLGNLIEFLALLGLVIGPVQSMNGIIQGIQVASASMDRVEEILNAEPNVRDAADASQLGPLQKGIRFEQVSFSYRGDQPQLDQISLEIPAGSSVAFVDPSGSGKSTIINVLLRFDNPDQGRIILDTHEVTQVTLESLRRQIGIVFQENFLFNTSARENIRYGREDAKGAEVEEAAKLAEIHEVILQLPEGYDTVVGERGGSLSGGQRQRRAIGRAILRRPSILVLDEATSALDERTENAINHTLAALSRGRTTVAVTHRLAAAMTADRIFVLDRGRLVEQGTHQKLLDQEGLYRRLFEEQGGLATGAAGQRALEVAYLHGVPIFADLDGEALGQIAPFLRHSEVAAGTVVVEAGAQGDKLHLVVSGELEVMAPGDQAQARVLAVLGSGNYFGEIALLRDVPRTATVRARTAVQLLSLDKEKLSSLLESIPGLRRQLEAAFEERGAAVRLLKAPAPADEARAEAQRGGASLEVRGGAQNGRGFPVNNTETGIGRNRGNDIVLPDRLASGYHARIRRQPDGSFQLLDSRSTNGTGVNGHRIGEPVALQTGLVLPQGLQT
ncbi:MAG: ABC transporter transmembrane domain-containing protein, partial [Dehalococcoidia bacterium]